MLESFIAVAPVILATILLCWVLMGEYIYGHSKGHALFMAGGFLLVVLLYILKAIVIASFFYGILVIGWFAVSLMWFDTAKQRMRQEN
jgi:hypothetical protein